MNPPPTSPDPAASQGNSPTPSGPHETRGWTWLPPRCRFRLEGPDATRYLNGQITNQIADLSPGESRYALITNHKGQLEADLYVSREPDSDPPVLRIDAEAALRESLHARLDRYIIADDVTLTDISDDEGRILHILGDPPSLSLEEKGEGRLPQPVGEPIRAQRFGLPGWDLWIPGASDDPQLAARWSEALEASGLPELNVRTLEWCRLSHGIPLWGNELTPGLLPPEARLESRAIDYRKGCYIGQEVLSRIKSVGKVNRLLVLLQPQTQTEPGTSNDPGTAGGEPSEGHSREPGALQQGLRPADTLTLADDPDGKSLGVVTSVAARPGHPREVLALGYVKSQYAAPGTQLLAAGTATSHASAPAVTLTVLPFPTFPISPAP